MSNPPLSVAAVGRTWGARAEELGWAGSWWLSPTGSIPPWGSGVRAAGAWEGFQVGCQGQLWVRLTLCVAQGKGHLGAGEPSPLHTYLLLGFFAWHRNLSALAPKEAINSLSSALERCCGFSQAPRKPRRGRWLDMPACCGARQALGLLEEGELGL